MSNKKLVIISSICVWSLILLGVKGCVTTSHHWRINDAIYLYRMECIQNHVESEVSQADMEDFNETLWRLWDWSDKRILSREDYAKIEKYIGQQKISDAFVDAIEKG